MVGRTCLVSLLVLVYYSAVSRCLTLTCPDNYRPYSCRSEACGCVKISSPDDPAKDYEAARTECSPNAGSLVLVRTESERLDLQRYLEVFGGSEDYFWTGYKFDSSVGEFLGEDGESAPGVVTGNIVGGSGGGDGLCLSFGTNGQFRSDNCTGSSLGYVCLLEFEAAQITVDVSPKAVLNSGTNVELKCFYNPSGGESPKWRVRMQDSQQFVDIDDNIPPTSGLGTDGMAYLIITVNAGTDSGDYECIYKTSLGTVVSEFYRVQVGTDFSAAPPTIYQFHLSYGSELLVDNSEIRTLPIGENIMMVCGYATEVSGKWYVNGVEMAATDSNAANTTLAATFQVGGVYQCRVTDSTTGLTAVESFTLFEGTPGPVRFLRASPTSQTGIEVEWFPPEVGISDPALLRYQIAFNTEDTFDVDDESTWRTTSEILPGTNEGGTTTYELELLEMGVEYYIAVLALSSTGARAPVQYVLSAVTYGKVPSDDIENLSVTRTRDNRTVVAFWDPIETTLPFQPVEFYEFQYRDAGKGGGETTSSVPGSFNYAVIQNVVNANDYEFRVRAAYEISNEPKYEYSKWTRWTGVKGITIDPPPVPPTAGLSDKGDDDIDSQLIAAAVLGPLLVLLLIVAIFLAVVYSARSRKRKGEINFEMQENSRLDEEKPPLA